MSRMSVATIDNPEFINLQPLDVNPLMSKCEIKVLYVGQNRNQSYITEEVATEMSKTLRGAPIVGWYNDQKDDFVDHGDRVTIDGDGIKFESLTKPYGFVSPDADVWFQNFEDTDEFGNKVVRKYLMTTGYLWTGQYEEAKTALEDGGRPQSMELDEESLDGKWSTDSNSGLEFFIINDATFSKLCILGEDVEPCFEGANISTPEVSTTFTVDTEFKQTLYKMMQELQFALEGGTEQMDKELEEPAVETEKAEVEEKFSAESDKNDKVVTDENQNSTEEQFQLDNNAEESCATSEEATSDAQTEQYQLLKDQYDELQDKFDSLQTEYQALVDFKNEVENEKKDALIDSFYMLSDEDKKDVIENKAQYSLDEIEAKLSVICVRKKVNFNLDEEETSDNAKEQSSVTTYTMNDNEDSSVPAWIAALRNTKNSRNN